MIIILIILMMKIKKHYTNVADSLRLVPLEVKNDMNQVDVEGHIIVLIDSLNKASLKALSYAKSISNNKNIVAFHISLDETGEEKIRVKWDEYRIDVPLIIKYSPNRELVGTLMDYIQSQEHKSKDNDIITIVMSQFIVKHSFQNILHNQTGHFIKQKLLRDKHLAVIIVPYVLNS